MQVHVDILTNLIIQQYFLNSRCLIIFEGKKNYLNYTGTLATVRVGLGIIVKTDNPLSVFRNFEKEIKLRMERWNQRKFLFVPTINMIENLTDLFHLEELNYVADLLVIQDDSSDIFSLYTHKYVGYENVNERVLVDIWFANNETFKYGANIYANKFENQYKRGLRMAAFQYEPYNIIGPTEDKLKGSEMSTALMFAKKYNMTPILVVNQEDYWGDIFSNWSGIGLLGNLAADRADIGFEIIEWPTENEKFVNEQASNSNGFPVIIGTIDGCHIKIDKPNTDPKSYIIKKRLRFHTAALYTWEVYYHFLDLTKPLVRTGITCILPAPKLAAGWLTPVYSFSKLMWLALGIVFIICVLAHALIKYINSLLNEAMNEAKDNIFNIIFSSVFTTMKFFILQVVSNLEMSQVNKIFVGSVCLLTLFSTSFYSSGFSSIMTVPRYENPIDTVEDFVRSGYYWVGTQDAWTTSIEKVEDPIYQELVRKFRALPDKTLKEYSKTDNFAFALERLPNEDYAIGNYILEDVIANFRLMKEDFYWQQCVIMTRKNHILLPLLDSLILRIFEGGLISYWQNEATNLYMNPRVLKALKNSHSNTKHDVVKLKWTHVEGAFGILAIGYFCSTFVFCIELLSDKFGDK